MRMLILQSMFRILKSDHRKFLVSCRTPEDRKEIFNWFKICILFRNRAQSASCWDKDELGWQGNVNEETGSPGDY